MGAELIIPLLTGGAKGYAGGKSYASSTDRAERKLGIYESQEKRTQKQFEDMQAAQEHFSTQPQYDGSSGEQREGIWDHLADDQQYDGFRKDFEEYENLRRTFDPTGRGKPKQVGPMSPTRVEEHSRGRDTSKDAYFQGIIDRGIDQYNQLPGEPELPTNELPALIDPTEQASPAGGSGGGGATGASAPGQGAIDVDNTVKTSNVASTPWNRIGDDRPRGPALAADGGPVEVLPKFFGGGFASVPAASPGVMGGWKDRLMATRGANREAGVVPDVSFGYNPGNTTLSQNTSPGYQMRGGGPTAGPIAIPGQQPGLQSGTPGILPGNQWGRAADGGPIQVLPKFQDGGQAQVPPAAPVEQPAAPPEAIPASGPQQQAAPPQPWRPKNDYRARMAAWQREGENMWVKAGGLEGLDKFRQMSNTASQKQILGYASQAVRQLNEGQIGEAMRSANTALEHTPFNTGLKFVANNGELFMEGPDGKQGKAIGAPELMAYIDDNMKTPENYLDFKKQHETARSNLASEKTREGELKLGQDVLALDTKYRGQETDATTLTALAKWNTSDAAKRRATQSMLEAQRGGWDENNAVHIQDQAQQFALDQFTELAPEVKEYFDEHPIEWAKFKGDISSVMLANPFDQATGAGSIDASTAAIVSQMVRQPGGLDSEKIDPTFDVGTHPGAPEGMLFAFLDGRMITLPKQLYASAKKNFKIDDLADGGGNKQSTGPDPDPDPTQTAALPVDSMGPPAPPPPPAPGAPELAPEDQDAGYRYIQLNGGQWQLANQQGDPVKSVAPPPKRVNPYEGMSDAQIMGQRRG
jgi:hypothetical protein